MENLEIDNDTTIWLPDVYGNIAIQVYTERGGNHMINLPFEVLEQWVATINNNLKPKGYINK